MSGRQEGLTHTERYVSQIGMPTAPRVPQPALAGTARGSVGELEALPRTRRSGPTPGGAMDDLDGSSSTSPLVVKGALGLGTRHQMLANGGTVNGVPLRAGDIAYPQSVTHEQSTRGPSLDDDLRVNSQDLER